MTRSKQGAHLAASAESVSLASRALAAGADESHVPVYSLGRDPDSTEPGIVPLVPRILHDREVGRATRFLARGAPVVAGNLGVFASARDAGARIQAHWGLNALNQWSVAALSQLGAELVWLSPELSGSQIATIAESSSVPLGIAVYGRQEVMVTEHCILMAEGECDVRCATCERRAQPRFLKDRKGYRFPVMTDVTGRSHLYNAVPLDLVSAIPEQLSNGIRAFRLDFTIESPDEIDRITGQVRRTLDAALAGSDVAEPLVQPATTGHYFRGVR